MASDETQRDLDAFRSANISIVSAMDQALAAAVAQAKVAAQFRKTLTEEGVKPNEALPMTMAYIETIFARTPPDKR